MRAAVTERLTKTRDVPSSFRRALVLLLTPPNPTTSMALSEDTKVSLSSLLCGNERAADRIVPDRQERLVRTIDVAKT